MNKLTALLLLFIIFWAIHHPAGAQDVPYMDNAPDLFFDKIEPERLVSRVRDLAAPAFQGRELGTAGNQKAADWLEFTFRDAGLNPFFEDSFTQQFPVAYYQLGEKNKLHLVKSGPGSDVQSDSTLSLFTQFVPAYYSASDSTAARAVFAGNGKSSTYGKIRTVGNIAVILQDQPKKNQTNYYPDYLNKANIASSFGASGVILTVPPGHVTQQAPTGFFYRFQEVDLPVEAVKNLGNTAYPYVEPASINIPVVFTSSDVLPLLFPTENAKINLKDAIPELGQISKRMVHLHTDVDVAEREQASNVAGFIPGTSPNAKTVILGAHFDQQGQHSRGGAPFFGANRNAAGVAVMLEIMDIFTVVGKRPTHNVVFIGWNGVERNSAGIEHFVTHLPIDKSSILGVINLNEIAGNRDGDDALVHSSNLPPNTMLYRALHKSRAYFEFSLRTDEHEPAFSEAPFDPLITPFYSSNIPVIRISGGRYPFSNRISDTPDKLNYTQMYNMTHYIMNMVWNLATIDFEHKKLQN